MEIDSLNRLKEQINDTISKRNIAKQNLTALETQLTFLEKEYSKKQDSFFGRLFSKKEAIEKILIDIEEIKMQIKSTKDELNSLVVNVDDLHSDVNEEDYNELLSQFIQLSKSNKIWKVISQQQNMQIKSSIGTQVEKQEVSFSVLCLEFINSKFKAFYLKNINGAGLFIYPSFVLQFDVANEVRITDIKDLSFLFLPQRFVESKYSIPSDSKIIDHVWNKVNKDGSRDLRFTGNFQQPVVQYGSYYISSTNGINIQYYISNFEASENFANTFKKMYLLTKKNSTLNISNKAIVPNSQKTPNNLPENLDPLYKDAATLIVANQIGSPSLIQRKMKLGYQRAGRLMDDLERIGIVGKNLGSRARDVLIKDLASLDELLENVERRSFNTSSVSRMVEPEYKFSRSYYDMLLKFIPELVSVTERLRNDPILTTKFAETTAGIKVEDFIACCIIHDLCQIVNILNNGIYDETSLETTGLVLSTNKILPNSNNDLINSECEVIAQLHAKGAYKEVAASIIDLGKNPLKISIKRVDQNNQILSNYKSKSDLSLPAALKASNHPLFDEYASILYKFSNIIAKADNHISKEEENKLKKIFQFIHDPIEEQINKSMIVTNTNESLETIMVELNSLTGLEDVKKEIKTLINFIKIQKAREASGLKSSTISYHIVFTGNPGTGKTTVARIIAKIYRALGISSQGQLVETDRSGLVAEYVGQTAIKVNKIVDSALNGILFIDEAYSITSESQNDYGKEAIATLIKRMEDDRDKLVIIVAGYTDEMNKFIEANPGLKSRFNRHIKFSDYSPNELLSIYESLCSKLDYALDSEAKQKLIQLFNKVYAERDGTFGNGRFVRNVFEKTLESQANRIASVAPLTNEILASITEADIPSLID